MKRLLMKLWHIRVPSGPCCIDRRLAGTDAVCSHQDVVNAAQVQVLSQFFLSFAVTRNGAIVCGQP
jgi:hypothetical protein